MKINNTQMKKSILEFMTWGSPLNQVYVMDAVYKAGIALDQRWDLRTNVERIKALFKEFPQTVKMVYDQLKNTSREIMNDENRVRVLMAKSIVTPDAWIGCARTWREEEIRD